MSFDEFKDDKKHSKNISVKKSTFNSIIIGLIVAVGIAAFLLGSYTSESNSNQITEKDLDEALAKLELKLLQNQLPTKQAAAVVPVNISADDDPVIGNPNAPITIIEFSDFQCPFCARIPHPDTTISF